MVLTASTITPSLPLTAEVLSDRPLRITAAAIDGSLSKHEIAAQRRRPAGSTIIQSPRGRPADMSPLGTGT